MFQCRQGHPAGQPERLRAGDWRSSSAARCCSRPSARPSPSWKTHVKSAKAQVTRRPATAAIATHKPWLTITNAPSSSSASRRWRGGHHGGAWKIAYADFVTAMMAFFLLMWLLGFDRQGRPGGHRRILPDAAEGGAWRAVRAAGDATSVIKGGGTDLTRRDGQVKKGDSRRPSRPSTSRRRRSELERIERREAQGAEGRLEEAIESNPTLKQFKKPAADRHHQRRPAHPDRRRAEPADVRIAAAPS